VGHEKKKGIVVESVLGVILDIKLVRKYEEFVR
jgi:hypothetical protein